MTNIVYRHYEKGDDAQLADLYNKAFQQNSTSFIRTGLIEKWRYANSPNFEPEMVQIAEDKEENNIVGAIFVNLLEIITINNKKYLVGDINDVSCHPDYTQQGIATNLMEKAIEYMERKNCDISLLTADYHGIARKKIYLKYGYEDATRLNAYINFPHYFRLIRDLPISMLLTPFIFYSSYLSRILFKSQIYSKSSFKRFSYQIHSNSYHLKFARVMNRIIPAYYDGYSKYTKEKVQWARKNVPYSRETPSYIFIENKKNIIGGASLTIENLYLSPLRSSIRLGVIHELAIERKSFRNTNHLLRAIKYLIDKIMKAAIQRNIGILLYMGDSNDKVIQSAFQTLSFKTIKGGVLMMKQFKTHALQKKGNLWFVPTYVSMGFP